MFKIVLLNLLTLSSLSSFSQTCDEYKIRENFSEEIKKGTLKYTHNNDQFLGPTRDQDSIGYCFAYAGADLYEHWLKKKGLMDKKEHVSAMAMGMKTHKQSWDFLMEKDFFNSNRFKEKMEAIEGINKKLEQEKDFNEILLLNKKKSDIISSVIERTPEGDLPKNGILKSMKNVCFESEVSSKASKTLKGVNPRGIDLFNSSGPEEMMNVQWFLNLENLQSINDGNKKDENCLFLKVVNTLFPGYIFSSLSELKLFIEKLDENRLEHFIKNACKDKLIVNKPKIKEYLPIMTTKKIKMQKIETMIENALKKGDIAVVMYHSSLLFTKDENEFKKDNHGSVITGSVDICGATYYALRNSWGKMECMNTSSLRKLANVPVFCNDNGDYMVRKDHFLKGAFGATVIEN